MFDVLSVSQITAWLFVDQKQESQVKQSLLQAVKDGRNGIRWYQAGRYVMSTELKPMDQIPSFFSIMEQTAQACPLTCHSEERNIL